MSSNRYSDWTKIDLHIHTDFSAKTKTDDYKGKFSAQIIREKMIQNGVGIFSMTDHNIINTQAYREYYSAQNSTDPLLLLGVELDINGDATGNTDKDYHSLLIFNISDIDGVTRVSDILESAYTHKNIADPFKRCLTIDDIIRYFPKEDFFFIPHAGGKKSIVKAYGKQIENAQRMVLLMQSAFEKVQEKAKQEYNKGFDKILDPAFKGKNDLAYIDFSDNHNIEKYPCIHKGEDGSIHSFWYIKGKKSFETLRLAFIDPKSRIMSSEEFGKLSEISINQIESLRIESNKAMSASVIEFSPHLNVIIGGRSSGKSLLMNAIGYKFGAIDSKATTSYKEAIDLSKVTIKTRLDSEHKDQSTGNQNFIYINQGDIVNYFEGRKLSVLAKKSGKEDEYQKALESIALRKTSLNAIIDSWISSYEKLHLNCTYEYVIYNQTINEMGSQEHLLSFNYADQITKYSNEESLSKSNNLLSSANSIIHEISLDENFDIDDMDKDALLKFSEFIALKRLLIGTKIVRSRKRKEFLDRVNSIISKSNASQSLGARKKQEAILAYTEVVNKTKLHFENLKTLKIVSDQIERFDYTKTEHFPLSEEINFSVETAAAGTCRELIFETLNGINTQHSLYCNLLKLLKSKISIKSYKSNEPSSLKKKSLALLQPIFAAIENPQDYLDYKNGETSKNKSPGFNSEQYLKVILNHPSTEVIFIDQPEDNLGNKFIAGDLVNILRDIKFKKQIFLVTHNPSIVVYGDAENVVIAQNDGNAISYHQVVLEEIESQKNICQILDGGEYIFDNRSRKYNIKRLLKEAENV